MCVVTEGSQFGEPEIRQVHVELNVQQYVKQKRIFADIVDRARLLRKFHLRTLYHEAIRSNDNIKAAEVGQAMREPLKEDSKEWRIWIEEAKKHFPDGRARMKIPTAYDENAYHVLFLWIARMFRVCEHVKNHIGKRSESNVPKSKRPFAAVVILMVGLIFGEKEKRFDRTEVDKAVQAIREMGNAYAGEHGALITDASVVLECLKVSPSHREVG